MKPRCKLLLAGMVVTGVGCLAALRYLFEGWYVHGDAMAPTLPDGAFVVSRRILGGVNRGDVVVVANAPDRTPNLITRVIAVAGDTVTIRGSDVLLNGLVLRHDAASADGTIVYETLDTLKYAVSLHAPAPNLDKTLRVPSGHVFVLADNRSEARDSRTFGPISANQIEYTVVLELPSRN